MQINITLDGTEDGRELNALAALIESLGGRTSAPAQAAIDAKVQDVANRTPDFAATLKEAQRDGQMPKSLADDHSEQDADIVDAAVAAGAPKTDSASIPWDERIHSASRATVADGTWRRRKNTPDATYDSVMAELKGGTPAPLDDDTPPPPTESVAPVATETPVAAVDNASEEDDTPPPPATSNEPDLSTFAKFVSAVNGKDVPADKKVYAALNALAKDMFGIETFRDMKDRAGEWRMFYDMVG